MQENNINIEQIKEQIKKLKFEILEKEDKVDELLKILNNESDFAKTVSPAIVGITSTIKTTTNIGSGVCVKSGGYIITNYHVIANGGEIVLHLHSGLTCKAVVIYKNPDLDIAVLKAKKRLKNVI